MKTIKTGIGILVMIGMAALYGCSAGQQNADTCFAIQTAVCAGEFNPSNDLPDFTKCTASAAAACGIANPPTPVPAKQMMSKYPQ